MKMPRLSPLTQGRDDVWEKKPVLTFRSTSLQWGLVRPLPTRATGERQYPDERNDKMFVAAFV